jgi:hypothetical protein
MTVKNWADGDLLTSAALNELTVSCNLRFPTTAARDAALVGGAAPVAGTTVTITGTNITYVYAVISGTGYWTPLPGTLCFSNYQTVAQSISSTMAINNLTGSQTGRNLGNWLDTASGKFTPLVPGNYEFSGAISKNQGAVGNFAAAGFRMNNTGFNTGISWSMHAEPESAGTSWAVPSRRLIQYMNGTTDYMELMMYSGSGPTTILTTGWQPSFAAKYMGYQGF